MTFDTWIKITGLTYAEAAECIGVANATAARRYAKGLQIPGREVMRRIYEATDGAVTPNDFYDLPAQKDRPCRILATAAFGATVAMGGSGHG